VVAVARRSLRTKRVGHAGTLDPFATGLLVLMVGSATRLLPYVAGEPKVYAATIRFGAETDTDDLTGTMTREAPAPNWSGLSTAIASLTGQIDQVPPSYSAKHVAGERAYAVARRGETVDLPPVAVTVFGWTVHERRKTELDVSISCAGGTYIRALARDLGRALGSAAHLASLRRERSGDLSAGDAVSIDALRNGGVALRSPLDAMGDIAIEAIDAAAEARIRRGMRVPASVSGARAALVNDARRVIAIAERAADERWQPKVVLTDA
jgi:tRNA pseudouridine55 synthase